ncbi:FtsK/SpoIIIE domain-containing protein [Clostridium perfringens]|uniref:FtsK/SpoIIIE domain-containing protein n=1 Tax=Clostridium perfringens TaxID=1502 RepID=UPI000D70E14B|nr:FtsK/SpoIIIE domain-containing protein [Clostridium perfringens]MDK0785689.1 FtsK/SpoIIIE domain-containing protein [Clostridium perfringens]MDK0847293.1 FtsK/SpoIIIE domain-containing protein [Clostridium perfringens]MDM0645429.1 FtsK/SpoIIIE domain-containing protein [Clostridium perfringens]MDM0648503.1 FtsK/SpoIIIE domain-containing protein [Clostridium perfringens]PWW83654.1 ATP-binding protein [Clostridium perfringens]
MLFLRNKSNVNYARKEGDKALEVLVNAPKILPWSNNYLDEKNGVINLGTGFNDSIIKLDLNKAQNVLIIAEMGVGKTLLTKNIIWQLVNQESDVYMIELSGHHEFDSRYSMIGQVLNDINSLDKLLKELIEEHNRRTLILEERGFKSFDAFNENRFDSKRLKRKVIVIDNYYNLLEKAKISSIEQIQVERIEKNLIKLISSTKDTGINLIINDNEISGLNTELINKIQVKICGRHNEINSKLMLGDDRARKLNCIASFLMKINNEIEFFEAYRFDEEKQLIKVEGVFIGKEPTFKIDFENDINNSLPGTLGDGKNFIVKGCDENEK